MKLKWKLADTAPRDGERFIAYDDKHGSLLFTMHFEDSEFLTDYELWSGSFSHWVPLPEPPQPTTGEE